MEKQKRMEVTMKAHAACRPHDKVDELHSFRENQKAMGIDVDHSAASHHGMPKVQSSSCTVMDGQKVLLI